jgi:gluconolactonase
MFNNKSITKFSGLIWSLAIISCVSCVSCDSKSTNVTVETSGFTRMSPTTCSNQSPSGELTATRIASASINTADSGLYEGPVWINDALYFSHFTFTEGFPSRILKLDEEGNLSTFLKNAGSNGLAADANGNLILASHKDKGLVFYNLLNKERQLLVGEYENNPFNSPNDIAITRDGIIYFTDPNYQKSAAPGGQKETRVYRIALDKTISVVDDSFYNPNGISLSPDEKYLYVVGNENLGVLRKYEIVDGIPQAGVNIATGINVPDGMAVDCAGNIYVTEHLGKQVRVYSADGQQIARIKVDANITNAAFGGKEGKTLYLTGAGAVWKVDLDITGSAY